jgi:hypothetical protein
MCFFAALPRTAERQMAILRQAKSQLFPLLRQRLLRRTSTAWITPQLATRDPTIIRDSEAREQAETNDLPQFTVGFENGFLPRREPLPALPHQFSDLEGLLVRYAPKQREYRS